MPDYNLACASLSLYRLRGLRPQNLPLPVGRPGLLSNTMLLENTRMFLPNGTSFHPTALGGYMSVTDTHTDGSRAAA